MLAPQTPKPDPFRLPETPSGFLAQRELGGGGGSKQNAGDEEERRAYEDMR